MSLVFSEKIKPRDFYSGNFLPENMHRTTSLNLITLNLLHCLTTKQAKLNLHIALFLNCEMKITLYQISSIVALNQCVGASSRLFLDRAPPAFAGGFGTSSTKNTSKKVKKRRGGLVSEDIVASPKEEPKVKEPKLDRFGLPVRTSDNFFPPLPDETEIIGMDQETSLDAVQKAMSKHIRLNYEIFDENAVEKVDKNPWKLILLHQSPPVLEIQNFFTSDECKQYMNIAREEIEGPEETDSNSPLKVNSATFSSLAFSKRTSTTWFCHYSQVPTLLAKAKRLLNNLPLKQMEEAQIVRYRTGEEFSWHYDEIPTAQLENSGQRIATLLLYLNTLENGGGTIFRDLKDKTGAELTMQPKQGSALLFFPAFADGTPDDRTLHKGEVAVEKKVIAQMWIHEGGYTPVIPEGNTHEAGVELVKATEEQLGYSYE